MQRLFLSQQRAPQRALAPLQQATPARTAALPRRLLATTSPRSKDGESAAGRTGGGEPLNSSEHPPPKPKVFNSSVPPQGKKLSADQQKEVEDHNANFSQKHDRAAPAAEDKVDKKFWSSDGGPKSVKN